MGRTSQTAWRRLQTNKKKSLQQHPQQSCLTKHTHVVTHTCVHASPVVQLDTFLLPPLFPWDRRKAGWMDWRAMPLFCLIINEAGVFSFLIRRDTTKRERETSQGTFGTAVRRTLKPLERANPQSLKEVFPKEMRRFDTFSSTEATLLTSQVNPDSFSKNLPKEKRERKSRHTEKGINLTSK